jgi:hypothetical protein
MIQIEVQLLPYSTMHISSYNKYSSNITNSEIKCPNITSNCDHLNPALVLRPHPCLHGGWDGPEVVDEPTLGVGGALQA